MGESNNVQLQSVCVFCGSSFGHNTAYRTAAADLGRYLANNNLTLVYGGGSIGLMGEMAREAMDSGGRVIGIIPKNIHERIEDIKLTEKRILESMHERKAAMYEESDAFIAMPGGLGTLDEFFEIFTWFQLGYHSKPLGLFNISGFFNGLLRYLDHAVGEGFIKAEYIEMLIVDDTVDGLMRKLTSAEPRVIEKLS